jgi:hypothetical protein
MVSKKLISTFTQKVLHLYFLLSLLHDNLTFILRKKGPGHAIELLLASLKHLLAMRESCYRFQVAAFNPENYSESLQSPNL